jgi:hypothetical protein
MYQGRHGDIRLKEFVAAFKLFMFYLDGFDTVDDGHQTGSQSLCLSEGGKRMLALLHVHVSLIVKRTR